MLIDELLDKWRMLKNKSDSDSINKLKKIENKLSLKCAEKNYKIIMNEIECIHRKEGGINSGKLWKLKKKMITKVTDPPSYKIDPFGNIIPTESAYKKLNEDVYKNRLREGEVREGLNETHKYNIRLF